MIDRTFLGFGGANEPEAGASNKEKRRRIKALKAACQQRIAGKLLPTLEVAIKSKVRRNDKWSLRSDDDVRVHPALLEQASFELSDAGSARLNLRADNPNAIPPIKAGTITEPRRGNDTRCKYNHNPGRYLQ